MYYVYAFYCTRYSTLYVRPCVRPDSVVIFKNHLLSSLCGISLRTRDADAGWRCRWRILLPRLYIRFELISYISPPSHRLRVRPRTVDRPHTVDRSHTDTGLSASHSYVRCDGPYLHARTSERGNVKLCAVCTLCAPLLDRACSVRPQNVIPSCKHACT